jgi:hypothetical protein
MLVTALLAALLLLLLLHGVLRKVAGHRWQRTYD